MRVFSYGSNEGWLRMLRPKIVCMTLSSGKQPVAASSSVTASAPRAAAPRVSRHMGALPIFGEQRRLMPLQDAAGLVEPGARRRDVEAEAAGDELRIIDDDRLDVRQ